VFVTNTCTDANASFKQHEWRREPTIDGRQINGLVRLASQPCSDFKQQDPRLAVPVSNSSVRKEFRIPIPAFAGMTLEAFAGMTLEAFAGTSLEALAGTTLESRIPNLRTAQEAVCGTCS